MGLASTRLRPYTALTRRCIRALSPVLIAPPGALAESWGSGIMLILVNRDHPPGSPGG